jgi:hypothetical protein
MRLDPSVRSQSLSSPTPRAHLVFSLKEKVLQLRCSFPRWGKDKLAALLAPPATLGFRSMVGRILTRLK